MSELAFEPINRAFADPRVFHWVKAGLFEFVDQVFGWDDDDQKQRMQDEYEAGWFYWATLNNAPIGLVAHKPYVKNDQDYLHLHLLLVAPENQGKGLGKRILQGVHELAREQQRGMTLSVFRLNQPALQLYLDTGYRVTSEEPDFLLLENPAP